MNPERFVLDRRGSWDRLDELLVLAEASSERALGIDRVQEIVRLYRQACSDLNEARAHTANPELLGRLNDLASRGYRFVYRRRRAGRTRGLLLRFLSVEAPRAFQAHAGLVLMAALALVGGALVGFLAVQADPANARRLVPGQFFAESAKERVARIEGDAERIDTLGKAASFGAQLYTHNIQVAFLAFALGALTFGGGLALLFFNGIVLGAVLGQYVQDGVATFFFAWVGPHGALEIPSIVFGGAAGLVAGRALLLPGDRSVGAALRAAFPDLARLLLTTAGVLVLAGLVEGSFSQFTARTFPYALKIGVALALFGFLIGWLFLRRVPEGEP